MTRPPTAHFSLSQGFEYASLTISPTQQPAPPATNTPEPGTYLMIGAGLVLIGLTGRDR